MDFFEDSTFDLIEESPIKGLKEVIDVAKAHLHQVRMGSPEEKLEILWNASILIDNVIKTYSLEGLGSELPKPDVSAPRT
ncbi:hypothetical protein AB4158_07285, partial [Vibrio splendidus]